MVHNQLARCPTQFAFSSVLAPRTVLSSVRSRRSLSRYGYGYVVVDDVPFPLRTGPVPVPVRLRYVTLR